MPNDAGSAALAAAVILAGGLGRRMGGGDKPLVRIAGRPMLDHVVERLSRQAERIVINANGDPARFAAYRLPVVADTIEGFAGPLAGILAGMLWTRSNAPARRQIVSAAADTPFFPADFVARLSKAAAGDPEVIALATSAAGTHPVFGLWPVSLADDLERFLRDGKTGKILAFVDRHRRVDVGFEDLILPGGKAVDPFFNVNTPEDAERAEEIAAALAGAGAR